MDGHTDIHLTRGDTSQNALTENSTVDPKEHEPSSDTPNEGPILDNDNSSSNVRLGSATGGIDIEVHVPAVPVHPFNFDQELSDVQTARNKTDREHSCVHLQSNFNQVILPAISKEVLPSELSAVPAGESTSAINTDDPEASIIVHHREPPLLRARTISSTITPADKREANSEDRFDCVQMLQAELDLVPSASPAHLTDEEGAREDLDYPCDDLRSSLPPSSSPPQLLSSSPYASSQSSLSDVEPSKLPHTVEDRAGSDDCLPSDMIPVEQDEFNAESGGPHSPAAADVATSPKTDKYSLQMRPAPCTDDDLGRSRKRAACQSDPDESYRSPPTKHLKSNSPLYLPPAPKRATLVSQHRQFKKLTAPFRPPSKFPIVMDGLAQATNRKAKSPISVTLETNHDKIDTKGTTTHLSLRNKTSNTSRPVAQFKSPLVNRALPAESRTIRLTPALQALERKLQLLRRAIKVREDKEEETLIRLTEKWIEAGRETAYDVWDATKDAGDFVGKGKAMYTRKSYGWENTNNGNTSWGWDSKPANNEDSCGPDSSGAPYAVERPVLEEEDETCYNTLGTMLRQLGIAPEIFGWDDDKETFSS